MHEKLGLILLDRLSVTVDIKANLSLRDAAIVRHGATLNNLVWEFRFRRARGSLDENYCDYVTTTTPWYVRIGRPCL